MKVIGDKENFDVVIMSEPDQDTRVLTTSEISEKLLSESLAKYDPTNRLYQTTLSWKDYGKFAVTPERLDRLAINAQNSLTNILDINSIVQRYININDIIGKTYESIESNVNTDYTLSYNDYSGKRNKTKLLDKAQKIIRQFNDTVNIKYFIRRTIPSTYAEGTFITYLRGNGTNYVIDYFPLGIAEISDYSINGDPCVLINITELVSCLQKIRIKTPGSSALFFDDIESEIKENYPPEVYIAYKNRKRYAKLDIKRTGVIRINNLNCKYGLTPIFRALKPTLMLETFENADRINARAKSKKIIVQKLRKELLGPNGERQGFEAMAMAHDNFMKAWKMPTVVVTPPACVEDIYYVEPKVELTNTDTIANYKAKCMVALGINFLNAESGNTVTTAKISIEQLMLIIDKISEQIESILKKWYCTVLEDNHIPVEYAPDISVTDAEQLSLDLKKDLASTLFTTLNCSYETAYEVLGINVENEKQRREKENSLNYDEIFKARQTANTFSGNGNDKNGRPSGEENDKQNYDKGYNKNAR